MLDVLTFVEAAPARDPGPAPHQVLVIVWDTHGDDVGLKLHWLVKSGNNNQTLETGTVSGRKAFVEVQGLSQ